VEEVRGVLVLRGLQRGSEMGADICNGTGGEDRKF